MQMILDDREAQQIVGGPADALAHARDLCEQSNRIITEVFLDEQRLDDEQLEALLGGQLVGEVLRCHSAEPQVLVRETLDYCRDALDQLEALHAQAAETIQAGRTPEALDSLTEILTLWDQVRMTVDAGCSLTGLDLASLRAGGGDSGDSIVALTEGLEAIKAALMAEDWVALSDCLGFEMGPVVAQWRELLERIDTCLSEGADGPGSEDH